MIMSHTIDRPDPPRPIIDCLITAVRCAIRAHTRIDEINFDRWAQSYGCTPDQVEAAFRAEMTKQTNSNPYGEGK
jgi:hypothetical protein